MPTRKEILSVFDIVISAMTDIRRIIAIVPNYKSLLHHVSLFRDFLERQSQR